MHRSVLLAPLALAFVVPLVAQTAGTVETPTPPPLVQSLPRPQTTELYPGERAQAQQRVYGPDAATLVAKQTAEGIVEKFRKVYQAQPAPRIVFYVNRALVDTAGGMKLAERVEQFEKTNEQLKTSGTNTYKAKETAAPTLADQQTVREIERLFGRAFRHAGAQLADQAVAASLLPETAGAHLVGESAAKDRQALANIADIAIEILISSRSLTIPEVSGDTAVPVPDIQATAIRLKDAAIIGQAAASDVIGKGPQAGRVAKQFGAQEITEATALALMEDMLTGRK